MSGEHAHADLDARLAILESHAVPRPLWLAEFLHGRKAPAIVAPPWHPKPPPGMLNARLIYQGDFWQDGYTNAAGRQFERLDTGWLHDIGRAARDDEVAFLSLDIEKSGWSMDQHAFLAGEIRKGGYDGPMSFYGVVPAFAHLRSVFRKGADSEGWRAWQALNEQRFSVLSDLITHLSPSAYRHNRSGVADNFQPPDAEYAAYWKALLAECRRFAPDRDIVPYISWSYSDSGEALTSSVWRETIGLMRDYADGAIVWGGYRRDWGADFETDPDWWDTLAGMV